MKRAIVYTTRDGRTFSERRIAAEHETNTVRVERITTFLADKLPPKLLTKEQIETVAQTMGTHANTFAELISARATRRYLAKGGNETPAPVGRRVRGHAPAKAGMGA